MARNLEDIKVKKLSLKTALKANSKRFLIETSLNGLKYIADVQRSVWERGYYLISFSMFLTAGLYMAFYFLNKWQSTPVIIGISPKATSILKMPFPAVTFCNVNQALASKVKDIQPDTPEYAMLQSICFQDYNYTRYENFKPRHEDESLENFKVKYSQNCSQMLIYCKFGAYEEPCTNLFRAIISDVGICCIFNRLHPYFIFKGDYEFINDYTSLNGRTNVPVNWSFEEGYTEPLPKNYYPRKAQGFGVSMGLTVALNADIDEYFCSSSNGAGFKVLLYNPIDTPNVKETALPLMVGHQTRMRIDTSLVESQPSLRHINPIERQCYFSNEYPLQHYKYYTRRCCEAECDAWQMLHKCKCIPNYMATVVSNATTCFLGDIDCVLKTNNLLNDPEVLECKSKCLAACHGLQYFPEMYPTPLATKDYILADTILSNFSKEMIHKNIAIVHIYYKNKYVRGNTKVAYMGLTEVLAQTGGVMGLMVGFSVISVIEAFFFIVLKPFIDVLLKRNPLILESQDEKKVKTKKIATNKVHPQMLFRRRRNIHNHGLNSDLNDWDRYHTERY